MMDWIIFGAIEIVLLGFVAEWLLDRQPDDR